VAALDERFVLYLGVHGPVRRALRDMTAGEVCAALGWGDDAQ
jgi:hypothetical protein